LYSAIPWNGDTSDALVSLMSGKEMSIQVPPKTFRLDGRITQRIRKWVSNRRTGDWESPQVPNVLRRNRGIFSLRRLAERRCRRLETGTQQSARYFGARYRRPRCTETTSVYCTHEQHHFEEFPKTVTVEHCFNYYNWSL